MKIFVIVTCFIIPLLATIIEKPTSTEETQEQSVIEEETPIETPKKSDQNIDVDYYRGPSQNLKSNIPVNAILKNDFNGNSYQILTTTVNGVQEYLTLEYDQADEACKKSHSTPQSLLTFKSREENAFVSKWLFNDLNITTQVWIGLTRVNGTNDFVWPDGTKLASRNDGKLFENWHKGEPNDITTASWNVDGWGEDCVEMYSTYYPYPVRGDEISEAGQWNDIPCTQIYNMVVCQGIGAKNQNEISMFD